MADARLYIINRRLGIGCRFYTRLGDAYSLGMREGMEQLLKITSEKLVTSDDFFITDAEACVDKIEGSVLVRFNSETMQTALKEQDQREREERDRRTEDRKEFVRLQNRIAMLANKLIEAGLYPG